MSNYLFFWDICFISCFTRTKSSKLYITTEKNVHVSHCDNQDRQLKYDIMHERINTRGIHSAKKKTRGSEYFHIYKYIYVYIFMDIYGQNKKCVYIYLISNYVTRL